MQTIIIILGIFLAYLSAFYCAYGLRNTTTYIYLQQRKNRFQVLDGLRGYLALGVFIHHGIMYWYFLNTGDYVRPELAFTENLGKVSVAIFFMITGFLFTAKLLRKEKQFSWFQLYKSRIFRLLPLYLFTLCIISVIVYHQTGGTLQISIQELIKDYIKWALFHGDTINGYAHTGMIISGVDWSLKYEWLFYLALPIIAVLLKLNSLFLYTLIASACVWGALNPEYIFTFNNRYFLLFYLGAMCAKYMHNNPEGLSSQNTLGKLFFVGLATPSLLLHDTLNLWHCLLIGLLFFILVSGICQFNLFKRKPSLILGEISYSIYLLHGLILYLIFFANDYWQFLSHWPVLYFLLVLPILSALTVLLSHLTFQYIELPGLAMGKWRFDRLVNNKQKRPSTSNLALQDANRKIKIPFVD